MFDFSKSIGNTISVPILDFLLCHPKGSMPIVNLCLGMILSLCRGLVSLYIITGSVGRRAANRVCTLWTDGRWQHLLWSWSMDRGRYRLLVCVRAHRLVAFISRHPMELVGSFWLKTSLPNLPVLGASGYLRVSGLTTL